MKIIARRRSEYCERVGVLPEEQRGFRPNRSTIDMMFVIRWLQELALRKRIPLYVCFIDLTKAYDSIDRTLLWTALARFDVPHTEYDLGHLSIPRWHASMRASRRQGVLGVLRFGTGPSSRVHARAPPVQHIFGGCYKRGLHARFKAFKEGIVDALVHPRGKNGAGGREEATAGESVLATPL